MKAKSTSYCVQFLKSELNERDRSDFEKFCQENGFKIDRFTYRNVGSLEKPKGGIFALVSAKKKVSKKDFQSFCGKGGFKVDEFKVLKVGCPSLEGVEIRKTAEYNVGKDKKDQIKVNKEKRRKEAISASISNSNLKMKFVEIVRFPLFHSSIWPWDAKKINERLDKRGCPSLKEARKLLRLRDKQAA